MTQPKVFSGVRIHGGHHLVAGWRASRKRVMVREWTSVELTRVACMSAQMYQLKHSERNSTIKGWEKKILNGPVWCETEGRRQHDTGIR